MNRDHWPGPVPPSLVDAQLGATQKTIVPLFRVRLVAPSFSITLNRRYAESLLSTTSAVPFPAREAPKFVNAIGPNPLSLVQLFVSSNDQEFRRQDCQPGG